jgi:group I intron endonuclease
MVGVYKITNPSGKIYIGQSVDIDNRFNAYKKLRCKGQIKLYNSLVKYGWDNHITEIIEECDESKLLERETYWKLYYNVLETPSLCCRIDGRGGKMSKESCETLSKVTKNYWDNLSEIDRVVRVVKMNVYKNDPIYLEKLRMVHLGKKKSKEEIEKLKISQNKPETVAKRKMSLRNYWDNLSVDEYEVERQRRIEILSRPEVKQKLSDNNASKRPEVKEKQILAALNRIKIECPHCGKKMDKANATKYHFDKCKLYINQCLLS